MPLERKPHGECDNLLLRSWLDAPAPTAHGCCFMDHEPLRGKLHSADG